MIPVELTSVLSSKGGILLYLYLMRLKADKDGIATENDASNMGSHGLLGNITKTYDRSDLLYFAF